MTDNKTALTKADYVSALTPAQKAAYSVFSGEWGRQPLTPEIKISYDDETKGLFIMKKDGETSILGSEVQGVIIKVRNQYTLWNSNKDEALKTNEFDNFAEKITLMKGSQPVKTGEFQEVKSYIKTVHPDMKFINIIYFLYDGNIYKIYVRPASRKNLWDFQAATSGRASFSFMTELTTERGTKGATVFYALKFRKTEDMTPEDFKKHFELRMELDKTLRQLEIGSFMPADEPSDSQDASPFLDESQEII